MGAMAVMAVFLLAVLLAKMSQSTVKQLAPDSEVRAAEEFYDRDFLEWMAPWAFLLGAGSTIIASLNSNAGRRR